MKNHQEKLSDHSFGLGTWDPDEEERASGAFDWGIFFALLDALDGAATKGAEDDDSSAMAGKFEELLELLVLVVRFPVGDVFLGGVVFG